MKLKVQNEAVRHNIELFKKLIEKHGLKKVSATEVSKSYHAFINRVTGDILFSEFVLDKKQLQNKTWKPICLHLNVEDPDTDRVVFEITEEGKNETLFHCDDLHPAAYRIMSETMKTLNMISNHMIHPPTMEKVFKEISQLQIEDAPLLIPGKDIIHEAWHQLNRIQAEELLNRYPIGSFFFRKGEYVPELEGPLREQFREKVMCFTLTYSEPNRKITDLTIVKKGDRWFIYNDDPTLSGASYSTINSLLDSLRSQLLIPILH